jgi:hypothetical protein
VALEAIRKRNAERVEKYGHVRPPVTTQHAGHAVVAVGSRVLIDVRWKTFHDFLFAYIGSLFEKDWFTTELSKPLEQRHPLMQWYHLLQEFGAAKKHPPGEVRKIESPPAKISALLAFAYDLYTLEHHGLLSERLVSRLKEPGLFQGARYEAFVAAACVRAGFDIELEDESDGSSTHCEFTVTHRGTGKKYSVEAKSRARSGFLGQAGPRKPLNEIEADLNRLLVPALRKAANHDRIVFIDVNVPPSESSLLASTWFNKIGSQILRLEKNPQGQPLPPAIVFFSNFPYHFVESTDPLRGQGVLFTGVNMPEFRAETADPNLVQTKHAAIIELHQSLLRHTAVPHELN